jgi:hypothetical protein
VPPHFLDAHSFRSDPARRHGETAMRKDALRLGSMIAAVLLWVAAPPRSGAG